MAVTDLTDSLPWWTRAGAGPTGTPAATPQGGGVGGQPPPGVDQQTWLNYLMQMFNPQGAQGPNPANMPSPDASETGLTITDNTADHGTGDNPPVTPFAIPGTPPGPMTGPAGPIGNLPRPPVPTPPAPIASPPVGGGGYGALGPQGWGVTGPNGGYNQGVKRTDAAYGPYNAPVNPNVPTPAAQPVSATAPAAAPAAAAPVPGPMATTNRFIGIDRPNANPGIGGGMLGGPRGGPQGTALNLAGLFGGGQPAAAPAAAAGPTYNNVGIRQTGVPGPLANAPMPPTMPDDIRRQRAIQLAAARSGFA